MNEEASGEANTEAESQQAAPQPAQADTAPAATEEPHPAHAVLDEIHRNLDVQMNVGWLRKKLDEVRNLL